MWLAIRQCWVLFLGLTFIMIGNGLQGTLVGVRSEIANFGNIMTGIIMGGYFVGLFIGSIWTPKLIAGVGHVRVFGALASFASIAVLVYPIFIDPYVWLILRILVGFSFAGLYIVCESWLNDRATNETRGQVLSIYLIIAMGGYGVGQLLLNIYNPSAFQLFSLVSVLISVAVLPVLISATPMPNFEAPERMSPFALYKVSPLGIVVMILVGIANGVCIGLGSPYMLQSGFSVAETSYFFAFYALGGLVFTWPLGKLSDIMDRRYVIILAAGIATIASVAGYFFGIWQMTIPLLIAIFFFGGTAVPIYSLCLAHSNDLLKPNQMVAASSTLLLTNAFGAVIGANLGGVILEIGGISSFFIMLGVTHLIMLVFARWRMLRRQGNAKKFDFVPLTNRHSTLAPALNPQAEWPDVYRDHPSDEGLAEPVPEKR